MLFFTLVINCMPFRNRFSNSACPIYPLSAQSLPFMFFRNFVCFSGSRSSTFPGVNMKLRISPLSLMIRWSLTPKNHPMEHFPRSASPLKVLWINIRWLRHTRSGVESTKLIPVQVPNRTSFSCSTKTIMGHTPRKEICQMLADIFLVVMLETSKASRFPHHSSDSAYSYAHGSCLKPYIFPAP